MAYAPITEKRKKPKPLHSTTILEVTFHINIYVRPLSNTEKGKHATIFFLITRFRRKNIGRENPIIHIQFAIVLSPQL